MKCNFFNDQHKDGLAMQLVDDWLLRTRDINEEVREKKQKKNKEAINELWLMITCWGIYGAGVVNLHWSRLDILHNIFLAVEEVILILFREWNAEMATPQSLVFIILFGIAAIDARKTPAVHPVKFIVHIWINKTFMVFVIC